MEFGEWTPSQIAQVVDLRPPRALLELIAYYEGSRRDVLEQVIGQAYTLGAQSAVVEYRYLDPDYRSEHSSFYSTTFRRYPSVAHRLHFFSEPPSEGLEDAELPANFKGFNYLGFTVLRPLPGARVGRTMIKPDEELAKHVTCQAVDRVNVFGERHEVRAAPFMAQDAQLGVCAHMTLWVANYFHHLAYGHPRHLAAEIADAVPADAGVGRKAPSSGLTVWQIGAGSTALGRPPLVYRCDRLPRGESIPRIACRYLNSSMPVIVTAGGRHAFVLVGYRRMHAGTSNERIHFICQDDEEGPYRVIDDFNHDRYGIWEYLIVPLPHKVFVPGETAETVGRVNLRRLMQQSENLEAADLRSQVDLPSGDDRSVTYRSTVMLSNRFKETLEQRNVPAAVVPLYRRMQLPRWIWVVEALLRQSRNLGTDAVLAEAIVDATDHSRDRRALAMRIPGQLWSWRPDEDVEARRALGPQPPYDSVSRFVLDPPLDAQPN